MKTTTATGWMLTCCAKGVSRYTGWKVHVDLTAPFRATAEALWTTRDPKNGQCTPEFTTPENDRAYIARFRKKWGVADELIRGELGAMGLDKKTGSANPSGWTLWAPSFAVCLRGPESGRRGTVAP